MRARLVGVEGRRCCGVRRFVVCGYFVSQARCVGG